MKSAVRSALSSCIQWLLVLFCSVLLSGCGIEPNSNDETNNTSSRNENSDSANLLTGVFTDGPVAGLSYQTATQSGVTNAAGEFSYQAGERVTFSIGGIELGTALGAETLSPFDLFGLTPPVTEAEIRYELATPNEVTDFDRVANLAMLLLTLDMDRVPGNGIDLGNRGAILANTTVDFDLSIEAFANQEMQRLGLILGVQDRVEPWLPLVHLYDSLGLQVPAHAETLRSTDNGQDGSINRLSGSEYDERGRLTRSWEDNNADGNYENQMLYTYDDDGNTTSIQHQFDALSDGVLDRVELISNTFGSSGQLLTEISEEDNDLDGSAETRSVRRFSYDGAGRIASVVTTIDTNVDEVPDTIATVTYLFNDNGRLQSYTSDRDVGADGVLDYINRSTYGYDVDGNQATSNNEFDYDGDGVIDGFAIVESSFDEAGNRTQTTSLEDRNGDALADSLRTDTYSYDAEGNLLSWEDVSDNDYDGSLDSSYSYSYTYDELGNETLSVHEVDANYDGVIDLTEIKRSTYDDKSNLLSALTELDNDGDGVVDGTESLSFSYDATTSKLLSQRSVTDQDGDGVADQISTLAVTYDPDAGYVLTETYNGDYDGDAVLERNELVTYSYTLIENGLYSLLYSYLK